MSIIFYIGAEMSFNEKSTWIIAITTFGAYVAYVALVLGGADHIPLTEVPYASPLLWTISAMVVVAIIALIVTVIASPKDADNEDQRDREINRLGEYKGQWLVTVGAVTALGMAALELDHFWIANVLYLALVLSTLLAAAIKIVAYRRGF